MAIDILFSTNIVMASALQTQQAQLSQTDRAMLHWTVIEYKSPKVT